MEGIRGLAVILVFFVHYHYSLSPLLSAHSASRSVSKALELTGHAGVDLFFMLSGFLIYSAVASPKYNASKFLRRRAERIYPAFLGVFGAYIVLSFIFPERSHLPADWPHASASVAANLLFLPGIFDIRPLIYVAWSLSYEALYYLGLPALYVVARLREAPQWKRLATVLSLTAVYFTASLLFGQFEIAPLSLRPFGHPRLIMFAGGIVLFELRNSPWLKRLLVPKGEWLAAALFIGALAAPAIVENPWRAGSSVGAQMTLPVSAMRSLLLLAGCTAFGAYTFFTKGFQASLMRWTPIRYLGNMSYSYYLVHSLVVNGSGFFLRKFLHGATLPDPVFWLLTVPVFAGTVVGAAALYFAIERRFSLQPTKPA